MQFFDGFASFLAAANEPARSIRHAKHTACERRATSDVFELQFFGRGKSNGDGGKENFINHLILTNKPPEINFIGTIERSS
jgi:hypothetical protein